MSAVRVILVTVAGPGGHVDIGVRSDATPAELIRSLSSVLGIGTSWPLAEHRAPPRPGEPRGRRVPLQADLSLAEAGVADGDLVVFRPPVEAPPPRKPQAAGVGTAVPGAVAAPPGAPAGALPSGQFAVRSYPPDSGAPPRFISGEPVHRDQRGERGEGSVGP
jgi:hypothetical protein